MRYLKTILTAGALCVGGVTLSGPVAASPLAAPTAIGAAHTSIVRSDIIKVQRRGRNRGNRRGNNGGAAAAGAAIGIIGGIIASQARPRYYEPAPVYVEPDNYDDAVAYCMRRFKSYDPRNGTYLGYDGYRHSCP